MLALFVCFYLAKRVIQAKIDEYTLVVHDFVDPPAVGGLSPLATILESLARSAGHSIALEVKTTLMGKISGASRLEAGVMSDIASDVMTDQSPLLSGLLDSMPSLKKRLIKNPQLVGSIMGMMQKVTGGQAVGPGNVPGPITGSGHGNASGSGYKAKFSL